MKKILIPLMMLALAPVSCSDWTQSESLEMNRPSLEEQHPEQYAAYLENLRAWKKSKHAVVLASFDNSTLEPATRAHHIASLPDSLDIVVLQTVDLPEWQRTEMADVRTRKGTRFIYAIDCARLESDWKALSESAEDTSSEVPALTEYVAERMTAAFDACDAYGYDGAAVWYVGRSTAHMTEAEIEAYRAEQEAFIGPVKAWTEAAADRLFLFGGDPTTLFEPQLLLAADYLLVDTSTATSVDFLTWAVSSYLGDNIPSTRFVVTVPTVLAGDPDGLGYYGDRMALPLAAEWVTRPSADFTRAGLLIEDIQRDFYNADLIYKHSREAIATINPSPKN